MNVNKWKKDAAAFQNKSMSDDGWNQRICGSWEI